MTLLDQMVAQTPPLHQDEGGVVRVAGTRVTLETLVSAYLDGMTAEEITQAYDAVALADVHAVLSFYLRHRDEVERYVQL